MNVIVLLKQVPDTESIIEIADDGASIKTEDVKWVVNPYDELAVEEALQVVEKNGEGQVTVLSAGIKQAETAIRSALAMGAHEGILIEDERLERADTTATGQVLAAALKKIPHDLIIAGQRAVDGDNYLVPAIVAESLDLPILPVIIKESIADGKITCEQVIQGGTMVVEADLPAVITTQRGLNEPRYASMPKIMKAKKKKIASLSLDEIGITDDSLFSNPKIRVESLQVPQKSRAGIIVEGGTPAEKADNLLRHLREDAQVI
ncbi:MAG: electron transfer flavoprotein subunit beta/FixA family protein [Desulfosarcina sp.]|nr:electron transfer flavoprotein subunit beta/FixA family protein [Desulfosarcina sp.]MBC2744410.1 electron transfer flavoprotein subunit beta/FixA family protein [Desulfosarcina sp.]MBC2767318.1 electron transfer flavoprotein subunit beta/FixA family protein [Desulfosarcina sp.]